MENIRCPGCGAPYDGKKCRTCLYKPMETNLSYHAKTVAVRPRQKQKKSGFGSLRGLFIILALIAVMIPGLRNWGMKLDAIEAANRTPEPLPGNPTVLFQHTSISVLVPEQDSSCVSLWFYNHGKEDAVVVCKDITVNGNPLNDASLSVYVPAGSAVKNTLLELETPADEITFSMEAQRPNGEFLFDTAPICLKERTAANG